ncbi:MAG: hypothetical protein JNL81_16235 [Hyphomonadaceae bacterium]|nr:hypothetical protein [Hyphomonadaceae bacterium]
MAFNTAIAWGAGACVCVGVLRAWHSITHRFESFSPSTMAVITAIVGAVAGLIGAAIASTTTFAVILFLAAFLGSFQGAAIAWFIVGPDLHTPPKLQSDPEEEDDTANPPTSPP